MPSVADDLNRLRPRLTAAAEQHEERLTAAYERQLRRIAREASVRFRRIMGLVVQASAEWTPPSVADVMAIQVNTALVRQAQESMMGALSDTLGDAGLATPGGVRVTFGMTAPIPQQILNQLGERAEQMSEALREPVAHAIARGWAEGASVPDTAGMIRAAAADATPAQARMLARTDLIGMSNGANQWAVRELNAAGQRSGEGAPIAQKQWLSAGDARVRDTHAEADGQTVAIDQPYNVGGSPLSYPGDPFGPNAEVCNCRCTELYLEGRTRLPSDIGGAEPDEMTRVPVADVFARKYVARGAGAQKVAGRIEETIAMLNDTLTGLTEQTMGKLGESRTMPWTVAPQKGAYGGYYSLRTAPIKINVTPGAPAPYKTFAHEAGHYLDHQALGDVGEFASEAARTEAMQQFRAAVERTSTTRTHRRIEAGEELVLDSGAVIRGDRQLMAYGEYLNRPREQWARAFAQYMLSRHGTRAMKDELKRVMQKDAGRAIRDNTWGDDEFGEIADAVEAVLKEAGLVDDSGALTAAAFGLLDDVVVGLLTGVERTDPLPRPRSVEVELVDEQLLDPVLAPPVVSERLRCDHAGNGTRAARNGTEAGVAFQGDADEEGTMTVTTEAALAADEPAVGRAWVSDIAYEGLSTGDGRYMVEGSLRWREPPLTLMAMIETTEGGHLGAQVAGRMDSFAKADTSIVTGERLPDGVRSVHSTGFMDVGEYGSDIERMIDARTLTGISVDLAIHEWGFRNPETGDIILLDEATDADWEAAFMGEYEFAVLDAEIMAATVCPTPAFAEAKIALLASATPHRRMPFWRANQACSDAYGVRVGQRMMTVTAPVEFPAPETLVASADVPVSPLNPPRRVFFRPEPDVLTPLTIDGYEVYGHLAPYDACHVGLVNGAWSQCVTPPRSAGGYAQFHSSGHVETEEGDIVPIGKLMISPEGHAPASISPGAAKRFYDKNGAAGAYVRAVDGKLGIWFSGQLRPGITAEEIHQLRANAQSGDWRGNSPHDLELIAAVTVAIPGYGVPSQVALAASADGEMYVQTMILTCQIGEPVGQTPAGQAAAALFDGGSDALHAMIAD